MRKPILVNSPTRQSGTVLIVALVMLVALMLLGVSGLSGTGLDLRMSAGMYEREIAFRAAEAAERQAQIDVAVGKNPVFDGTKGLYPIPDPSVADFKDRWDDPATLWANVPDPVKSGAKELTPQYIVEDMDLHEDWYRCGSNFPLDPLCWTPRYRITARSSAPAAGARVVLQSTFRP